MAEENDGPRQDNGHRGQEHIIIVNMGQFMGKHPLQFEAAQAAQQAAGDGDRRMFWTPPGGKSVGHISFDDINLGDRTPRGVLKATTV